MIQLGKRVTQFNVFDKETGELLYTKTNRQPKQLFGNSWNMVNRQVLNKIVPNITFATSKVLLGLIGKCNFEEFMTFSAIGLAGKLNIDRRTAGDALQQLQMAGMVRQVEIDGAYCWLMNPWFVTCGNALTQKRRDYWAKADVYASVAESAPPLQPSSEGGLPDSKEDDANV